MKIDVLKETRHHNRVCLNAVSKFEDSSNLKNVKEINETLRIIIKDVEQVKEDSSYYWAEFILQIKQLKNSSLSIHRTQKDIKEIRRELHKMKSRIQGSKRVKNFFLFFKNKFEW